MAQHQYGSVTLQSLIVQESHAVARKPRDAAVNSDRYQQPVRQKQSECETENIT